MALGYHVRFRARDDRVVAPSDVARRRLARTFVRVGRDFGMLGFNAADTHSHAVVCCDRASAGEFARRVEISLGRVLDVECGFQPAWLAPIRDQRHLDNTFWYILRQQAHHGLASDPLHEGSVLPDLLGLRAIGATSGELVRERLPRTTRARLLDVLGVSSLDGDVEGLEHLLEAAASAAALPGLEGHTAPVVAARLAAVAVGLQLGTPREVAAVLGITAAAVRKLAHRPVDEPLRRAIMRQVGCRAQLGTAPTFAATPSALYVV